MYRQFNERVEVSLEQGTPAVPDDDRFHLLRSGKPVGNFPTLKRGMVAYQKLVAEILAQKSAEGSEAAPDTSKKDKKVDPVKESTERFLDAKDAYWTNSHKYRHGGRLGRR